MNITPSQVSPTMTLNAYFIITRACALSFSASLRNSATKKVVTLAVRSMVSVFWQQILGKPNTLLYPQQPVNDIHDFYAFIISEGEAIKRQDDFLIIVLYST